jgi:hypothetical protein
VQTDVERMFCHGIFSLSFHLSPTPFPAFRRNFQRLIRGILCLVMVLAACLCNHIDSIVVAILSCIDYQSRIFQCVHGIYAIQISYGRRCQT